MHFIKDDVGLYTCFNPNAKAVDTWYSVKGLCIDNTHLDMHYIQDGFGLFTCFNPNAKAVDTWYSA